MNPGTATAATTPLVRPRLRGFSHAVAAAFSLITGAVLVYSARDGNIRLATAVYAASMTLLFSVSGAYHSIHWEPRARAIWRRIDHASVFLLIGGTYTPFCLAALGPSTGRTLAIAVWATCAVGVARSVFWPHAPRWLVAGPYVVVGWFVVPYLRELSAAIGPTNMALCAVGGVTYTLGALVYVRKWPDPWPLTFGFHEVMHLCVIGAAAVQYAAVWRTVVP